VEAKRVGRKPVYGTPTSAWEACRSAWTVRGKARVGVNAVGSYYYSRKGDVGGKGGRSHGLWMRHSGAAGRGLEVYR
jgi:hypothetical protein